MTTTGTVAEPSAARSDVPLCVDLDGTLTPADTLMEALVASLRHPGVWVALLRAASRGRAALKHAAAEAHPLDPANLPFRDLLVARLQIERARGREILLASGADGRVADAVAAELGCFSGVIASDGVVNRTGDRKREALIARYGDGGFDYVGAGAADLRVARAARIYHPVILDRATRRWGLEHPDRYLPWTEVATRTSPRAWLRALRPENWAKNVLVFVPAAADHHLTDPRTLALSIGAFVALSFAASSGYLANDALDIDHDRRHRRKRLRPQAAGLVRPDRALIIAGGLIISSLTISFVTAGGGLGTLVLAYALATIAYSLRLKREAPLDTVVLACLHLVRIGAGAVAASIPVSGWLFGLAFFGLWSLALAKRVSDLDHVPAVANDSGGARRHTGRAWIPADRPLAIALGTGSACAALVLLILYSTSADVVHLYPHREVIAGVVPLAAWWLARLWLIANRGKLTNDPVLWGLTDRGTWVLVGLTMVIAFIAGQPTLG